MDNYDWYDSTYGSIHNKEVELPPCADVWRFIINSIQFKKSLLTKDMNITIIQIESSSTLMGWFATLNTIILNKGHSSNRPIKLFNYIISFLLNNMLPIWILKAIFICASLKI